MALRRPGWLADYEAALRAAEMSHETIEVILEDSRYIADRACPPIGESTWGSSRVRTGAVMGAVQSGKTASMLGVLARALDNGVNVLVVLGGTRRALWLQTFERLRQQLDSSPGQFRRRVFIPNPKAVQLPNAALAPQSLYRASRPSLVQAFSAGKPIVVVAMKQVDHLQQLAQTMHKTVFPAAAEAGVAVRLLVLDDEADDASVEDSRSDNRASSDPRWIPTRIRDLWATREQPMSTAHKHVFATYIGYTATPQANFLQNPESPLAPRDFVASLRTPGPDGLRVPRTLTYRVGAGVRAWYTGADVYYGPLAESLLIVSEPEGEPEGDLQMAAVGSEIVASEDEHRLIDSVRAYLTASAIRLARQPERLGPATARTVTFDSRDAADAALCKPSSMLIHPSSGTTDHFQVAAVLRKWWLGDGPEPTLGAGVLRDIAENEDAWCRWVGAYRESSAAVASLHGADDSASSRAVPEWHEIRRLILDELIEGTRIVVINSDPAADDRPNFAPEMEAAGWRAPTHHSTIFVSGNVMARGLTLEGLLTTLFTRSSRAPLADSQMQMQRWFGYRGDYIDLCRVFLTRRQADLFVRYAEADHSLRQVVLAAMTAEGDLPTMTVLQGTDFRATGKVHGVTSVLLSPGRQPFVGLLNPQGHDEENLSRVAEAFELSESEDAPIINDRGMVRARLFSLLDAADLLDSLRYESLLVPRAERDRWSALEARLRLSKSDEAFPLLRPPPGTESGSRRFAPSPYSIAAYLRFWSAALERQVVGITTDEDPPQKWRLLNLDAKSAEQPRFRIGLRFGSGSEVREGPIAQMALTFGARPRTMKRAIQGDRLSATWGSRNATDTGYLGDQLFDFQMLGGVPDLEPDGSRRPGSCGLILFHLIDRGDSRGGIAVGVSIPAGGPQHVEAFNGNRKAAADEPSTRLRGRAAATQQAAAVEC